MRIGLAALVFAVCLSDSTAILRLLKSKLKPGPAVTIKYLPSPVVLPEPISATYARPVPPYAAHVSNFALSAALPSAEAYAAPVVPAHAPAVVYAQPWAASAPFVHHHTFFAEPYIVEELYDEDFAKH